MPAAAEKTPEETAGLTEETPLLDYTAPGIQALIKTRGWRQLEPHVQIGAVHDFTRNEILFGYNISDQRRASDVLADGYGQCNTKGILLMALLRALGLPCRMHGFTIRKALQRGVVPELIYPITPENIVHSWVEVFDGSRWVILEGFILDDGVLSALQQQFPGRQSLCAFGAGTDNLQDPQVTWTGADTFIQKTGINQDFDLFDSPDAFFAQHRQEFTGLRGPLFRHVIRHWMNLRVRRIRAGRRYSLRKARFNPMPSCATFAACR